MKTYQFRLLFRLFWVLVFALSTGAAFALQYFEIAGVCLCFTLISIAYLISFQRRSFKDMRRLISAIEFSELNISFQNSGKKGLVSELIPEMETAISLFNKKLVAKEAQQNFYESLLSRIDFAIIVIDRTGKIEWINKFALDMFGKPQPRKLYDLAKTSLSLPEELDSLIPKETKTIRFTTHEKKDLQVLATAIYFSLEEKNLKLISLKNIQSILEESESEAWKKLIRVLTHEIMNSLSPIISLSETFSNPEPEARDLIFQAMQTIHRRSKGLIEFVHNYQKLTRIPAPVKTKFPAKELMQDISSLLCSDYPFTYHLVNKHIMLHADRGQIEQVLINLIKNACESSVNKDSLKVEVKISLDEYNRTLIRVKDNGQGILPETMENIFVPFFTTKSQGSGIGLSICRQIVNLHEGSISVESEAEKGSCFSILL